MLSRFGFGFLHFVVLLQSCPQKISEWISLCHTLSPSLGVLCQLAPVVIWVSDNDRAPALIFMFDGFSNFSGRFDHLASLVGFKCGDQPSLGGLKTLKPLPLWTEVEPD